MRNAPLNSLRELPQRYRYLSGIKARFPIPQRNVLHGSVPWNHRFIGNAVSPSIKVPIRIKMFVSSWERSLWWQGSVDDGISHNAGILLPQHGIPQIPKVCGVIDRTVIVLISISGHCLQTSYPLHRRRCTGSHCRMVDFIRISFPPVFA